MELTTDQSIGVHHGEGPLLIVAGAGTGKTYCIARRVAHLISSKAAHMDELLILTFSDKAAEEMEDRIDMILPYAFSDIWVSTFHSFGRRLLNAHAFEMGLDPDFKILTDEEMILLLEENLFTLPLDRMRPLGNPAKYLKALVKYFSRLKDEDISPEEYLEFVNTLKPSTEAEEEFKALHSEFAQCYKSVRDLMFNKGYIDLADLIYLSLQLLRHHPLIADIYRNKFKYILVDEFQDTNYAQYQILKILAQGRRNITVVGDDDQSIYKFRGAAISNILNFQEDFPDAKMVVLTDNFRSPQMILDASYKLISHNNPYRLEAKYQINKQLKGKYDPHAVIFHRIFDTMDSQSQYIAQLVEESLEEGYSYKEICILIRNNKNAEQIIREFNLHEIPFTYSGSRGLYLRPEIRSLICFFRILTDYEDSLSLYYLAESEIYGLNSATLTRLTLYADHSNLPLLDVFRDIGTIDSFKTIPKSHKEKITKIIGDIKEFSLQKTVLTSGRLLYEFLKSTGYLGRLAGRQVEYADIKTQNIAIFFDIIKRFEEVTEHPYALSFIKHLNNLMRAGDDPSPAQADADTDAVSILTVHKAKGLEFPIVIMAGLAEGSFPSRTRSSIMEIPDALVRERDIPPDFHIQEERRLFYVAMTRAKKKLYMLGARNMGGKRNSKVSRFIMEALDLTIKEFEVKTPSSLEKIKRFGAIEIKKDIKLPTGISDNLTLSVYHIEDYLACPLKYKYVQILRIPVMKHHSVVYGKALKTAFGEYLKRKVNSIPVKTDDLLSIFTKEWHSEGFLSREHEEMRFNQGKEILKQIMKDGYADTIPKQSQVEKEYRFFVGDIKVRGSWDLLEPSLEGTVIKDYRTSSAGSKEEAARKAKDSLKNNIALLAYSEVYNENPVRLDSIFIESGFIGTVKPSADKIESAKGKITAAAEGITAQRFEPTPGYYTCLYCAYREICPATERDL